MGGRPPFTQSPPTFALKAATMAHATTLILRRCLVISVTCLSVSIFAGTARAQNRPLGIDVSEYQGTMNWRTAYDAGVRFAFVRATRGPTTAGGNAVVDATYTTNVPAARAAGVLVGVYHFGRPDTIARTDGTQPADSVVLTSAKSEATQFYGKAGAYMAKTYVRPVLDLEARGGAAGTGTTALNAAKLSLWANTFCDELLRLSGAEPIIYMNTSYAKSYVNSSLAGRKLWIARWNTVSFGDPMTNGSPPVGVWDTAGKPWSFWQYSSDGNGEGPTYGASSADIDLNSFNGTLATLQRDFVIPEPATVGLLVVAGGLALIRRRAPRPSAS